ncbi:unnamed protein product [Effrenium voratum]|uniref:Signal recognition particle 19 kDa protein n=1 Tax=Effrenium voratum TaxID=2562239 RepID=A0AA36N5F3_9DINO|nr:unnamed protein product [Effrenium voratum]
MSRPGGMDISKWNIIYPNYINSKKTVQEGRRVGLEKARSGWIHSNSNSLSWEGFSGGHFLGLKPYATCILPRNGNLVLAKHITPCHFVIIDRTKHDIYIYIIFLHAYS